MVSGDGVICYIECCGEYSSVVSYVVVSAGDVVCCGEWQCGVVCCGDSRVLWWLSCISVVIAVTVVGSNVVWLRCSMW